MAIKLGCFSRPWNGYTLEEFIAGTAAAGYDVIGTMALNKEPVISADMSDDEVKAVRELVEDAGLAASTVMGQFPLDGEREVSVERLKLNIDKLAVFGAQFMLHCGAAPGPAADRFYDVYAECCGYAEDQGVMLTLKPHGGITNTGADLVYALDLIDHDNFRIYYDAGNIVHYKGLNPVNELRIIADFVVGMCVKDSEGELIGVNILPGAGVVDFEGVFAVLKDAGFDGHLVVECLGGETLDEVNANAVATREFLEGLIA